MGWTDIETTPTFSLSLSCDEKVRNLRLQRTARQSVISLACLPGHGDSTYGGVDWLGKYFPHAWMGSSHPPEWASSGVDQKGPLGQKSGKQKVQRTLNCLQMVGSSGPDIYSNR